MPGVLPLKTIQLNSSSQSRIAQACDRCRSKKIRCDGIQPNCTPCQAVDFECKTSDKLSRKAYPKGYTSSLEERVRELEAEVRDLKNLLDEKDEKIDILSKMRRPSVAPTTVPTPPASTPSEHGKDDSIKIHQPQSHPVKGSGAGLSMGASSGRQFIDVFKAKLQEDKKRAVPFETSDLFHANALPPKQEKTPHSPPRVVSDQLINIFFQEWAPLFPILHRPTFLKTYQEFLSNPRLSSPHSHAQMYLVFGIATLASSSDTNLVHTYESQWRRALNTVLFDTSIETLQCLVLAQIHCIIRGDYRRLVHYLGIAVTTSSLLGLHRSQQHSAAGALVCETRKRVFWSLYTVDCFAAASLGFPRLIQDSDVQTEEPCNVDDENVSDRGFQATLPGEHTKISSALALFKAAKVLSNVLDQVYPSSPFFDLSLSKVAALGDELDAWRDSLPAHLRLTFTQDRLNVNVTSDRSPLLALIYFHIRSCIHRPVVAADVGDKAMSSLIALAESSRRIAQIAKLLEQRQMSFTLCINRNETLSLAGIGLLFQAVELDPTSTLCRENGKVALNVAELVSCNSKSASVTLKKVAVALFSKDAIELPSNCHSSHEGSMSPPKIPERKPSPKDQLQAITSRFSFSAAIQSKKSTHSSRRATAPATQMPGNLAVYSRSGSLASQDGARSAVTEPVRRTSTTSTNSSNSNGATFSTMPPPTNLDYLSIEPEAADYSEAAGHTHFKSHIQSGGWDPLLGPHVGYDASTTPPLGIDGADYLSMLNYQGMSTPPLSAGPVGFGPDAWGLLEPIYAGQPQSATTNSVLSISDESLTSGEDLSSVEFGADGFPGYAMPAEEQFAPGFDELIRA